MKHKTIIIDRNPATIFPTEEPAIKMLDAVFAPDLELGVTDTGHIYSRSPKTRLGSRLMLAIYRADIQDIDKAMEMAAKFGATVETH